jgi:hypothetical protein
MSAAEPLRAAAARLVQLTGTRAGGFVLTREEAAGKMGCSCWPARARHRGHSGHGLRADAPYGPYDMLHACPMLSPWRARWPRVSRCPRTVS